MNNSWGEADIEFWKFYEKKTGIKVDIEFLKDHKDETIQNEWHRRMKNGSLKKEIYEDIMCCLDEDHDEKEKIINDTKQHIARFTYNGLIDELNRRKLPYRKFKC